MAKSISGKEASTFFVATIALALGSWPVSFALGAYGEVFYTSVLTLWVASLAALFASLVIGRTAEGEAYVTRWGSALLLIPSLSLTSAVWYETAPWLATLFDWGLLLAVPYIGYILIAVSSHEAFELRDRRLVAWLAVGFVGLNALAYLVGMHNYIFMTCADFAIAGDHAPDNCWRAE